MKQLLLGAAFFFACLLLLTGAAEAANLEYYGIEDTIGSDMVVQNKIVLIFKEPVGHLDYRLGFRVSNLTAESDFAFAECVSEDSGEGSTISCDFTGMTPSQKKLTLGFDANGLISKKDGFYRFNADYGISMPIDLVFAIVRLPENGILSEPIANQSYFPQDGKTLTDGRRIMVYWRMENMTDGSDLQFSVMYSRPDNDDPSLNYMIIFLATAAIAAMIAAAFYMKRGGRIAKTSEVIESVLNKDENIIVSILNKHEGKAGQKVIVRESGFSKAKVSRLVNSLKGRGVLDTEPISGRENRVMLKAISKEKPIKKEEIKQ